MFTSFMNELEGASLVADGQDSLVSKLILTGCYSVTNTYLFLIENTNLLMSFSTGTSCWKNNTNFVCSAQGKRRIATI
ncbi:hypothetical protein AAZX31_07G056700 [Glycine max]